MILDNADNRSLHFPTIDASTSYEDKIQSCLTGYLPLSSIEHGYILITTRNKKLGMDLAEGDEPVAVEPFTPADAKLLLESKILKGFWDAAVATDLLEVLGYIPLAITQAAAYMRQNKVSMEKYLKALSQSDSNLIDHLSTELVDPRRLRDTPSSVFLTWKLSFDQISKEEPRAAELLSLMALLDRQGIPEMLLRRGDYLDVKDTNAIGTLQAFSLIIAERDNETYSMHRLVQLSTQTWLALQKSSGKWEGEVLGLLSKELPNGEYENWTKIRILLPHATAVLKYKPGSDSDMLRRAALLYNLAWFEWKQGRNKNATSYCEESYSERQRILGPEDWNTLNSSDLLALLFLGQGQWKEAEILFGRLVETKKKVLGAEYPSTLNSMNNLASTYWNQGRWKEAEELNAQVLETRKRVLGAEHPETLTSIQNVASTYWNQGRWKEAEELSVQVIESSKAVLGAEHPDTLSSIGNLASTYRNQGRWNKAEELNLQVLETRKRVLGAEHPETLTSMSDLASTYWNQGRWKEAEELEVQVLETRKRVLGAEHPETLRSMNNLAWTFKGQGRREEAIQLMEHVVKTREATIGTKHPDTLNSASSLENWTLEMG